VRKELQNPEPRVRQTAAKIVSLWRDGAAIDALLPMLETASQTPHLSRVAAEALGRIGDARAIPSLLRNAPGPSDRFLEHAYIYALEEIANPKETALGLAAASINTRRAALIALNEMPGHPLTAETAVPLLSSSDPLLRETALWLASRHTDWGGPLAGFAKEQLATADKRAPSGREDLAAFLHQCAKAPEIQALLADTIRQGSPTARTVALNAMGHTDAKEIPEAWSTALSAALAQSDPAVLAAAVTTARVFNTRKTALTALRPALLALAANADRPAALRLAALAALPTGYVPGTPENFTLLLGALKNTATSSLDRGTAASILGHTKLTAEQRGALADAAATFGPQEASKILPAFESGVDPALGHRLLASLAQSPGLAGLQPQALRAVVAKLPPSLEAESTALLAKLQVDASAQKAHLDSLAAELPTGDIRRGQAIFNSQRVGCTLCHSIGYLGGKLGPDLSSVGKVRNERDLLEAIVYPSASFVRSYEPTIVRTAKGEEMMGIVKGESNDGLTLAMAPGVETHIPRAEIAELRPGTVSLMPQGFEQILTKQELADVIAFLKASQR
jgi:putative heme-binding domain-containing protein